MAFYNPPGAPQQGGLTVDSSRYMNAPAAPVVNPFDKAFELKKQAMEMKGMERQEKESISQEVANKLQGDIFSMGDASADFDPDAILEGGMFNNAELQKRKFNDKFKASTWKKYQSDAKIAGGIADRQTFETVWGQGKAREDAKILNEMWSDVQENRMSEKDFNLAVRDNGSAFRDMYKDMTTEQKQSFQQQYMETQGWDRYTPGYETTFEKYTGTGPGDEASDMVKSPVGIGIGTAVLGSTIMGIPGVREGIGKLAGKVTGAPMKGFKGEVNTLKELRQKAKGLGYDHKTGKAGRGKAYANSQVQVDRKAWNSFNKGAEGKELKSLEAKAKAGQNVNPDRLKELQGKRDTLKANRTSSSDKLADAKKAINRQQQKITDLKSKMRGGGGAKSPVSGKAGLGKYFRGAGGALTKGATGGMFAGYITGAGSRMLLGEDSKGAKLTNEAMEAIGTQAGMGSGQVAMMKKIKNAISKKGYKWALKKVAKKGGLKLAMGVGAKAVLGTAGGIVSGGALTAVSATLLAKDLYDIAQILSE